MATIKKKIKLSRSKEVSKTKRCEFQKLPHFCWLDFLIKCLIKRMMVRKWID